MAKMEIKGGEKLEAALKLLALKAKNSAILSVGFPVGSTEDDGTPTPLVAAINEFGAPSRGQPPRPFFRNMIAENKDHWGEDIGKLLKANDYDAVKALELMGKEIEGELVESIEKLIDPPLKQSTIDAKKFSKPLVHTGTMMKRVSSFVDKT
jgi:hypothetical protein